VYLRREWTIAFLKNSTTQYDKFCLGLSAPTGLNLLIVLAFNDHN
jgi:hypothetical protein